jgi:hypothetical protein
MYECQCDERLKAKAEGSTRLTYTSEAALFVKKTKWNLGTPQICAPILVEVVKDGHMVEERPAVIRPHRFVTIF